MAMLPGTYLRLRREAADLSIEDVAMLLPSIPETPLETRVDWLRQIESGGAPVGREEIKALRYAFAFDPLVLLRLEDLRLGATLPAPRICSGCGCTETDACVERCHWIAEDRCSNCPESVPVDDEAETAAPSPDNDGTEEMAA